VISQHGRPDDGTDSTGFFNAEFFVPLKPFDQWRKGLDKDGLIAEMNDALTKAFPGVEFTFSQYIQDNVQEAASGVKGENSVKVYGPTSRRWARSPTRSRTPSPPCPASPTSPCRPRSASRPSRSTSTAPRRRATACARRRQRHRPGGDRRPGGGRRLRERQRPPLSHGRPPGAALSREHRGDQAHPDRRAGHSGITQVPLSEVATVDLVSGAYYIYREQQERYVPVKFSVRGRDLGSAILEAQQRVAEKVKIPGGYRVEWVGEFGNLKSACSGCAIAVPIAIGLILLLLFTSFGSLRDTLLAGSAIPMALVGGVLALF
jgi:cobalt-zinc-cadmium resistance protein CzcA